MEISESKFEKSNKKIDAILKVLNFRCKDFCHDGLLPDPLTWSFDERNQIFKTYVGHSKYHEKWVSQGYNYICKTLHLSSDDVDLKWANMVLGLFQQSEISISMTISLSHLLWI